MNSLSMRRADQRGSVLIVGLIMLIIITVLGMAAIRTSTQQERMAGFLRDKNDAFQTSEIGLRGGESYVEKRQDESGNGWIDISLGGSAVPPGELSLRGNSYWDAPENYLELNKVGDTSFSQVFGGIDLPRFIREKHPNISNSLEAGIVKEIEVFRVSSRGVGRGDESVTAAVIQSSYKR